VLIAAGNSSTAANGILTVKIALTRKGRQYRPPSSC
jgi:hypothetical protein